MLLGSVVFALLLFADEPGARFFDEQVAPILARSCLACHNHELDDGEVSFEDRATLVKQRKETGPAIVPGEPEKSPLIRAIQYDGDVQMPPGKKLPARESAWVRMPFEIQRHV